MSNQKVAVYGSLLSGLGNHRVMQRAEGELLGHGLVGGFDLWDYAPGGFPAISENPDAKLLSVEVYEVPLSGLEGPLDSLEGYPSFYDRKQVQVRMDVDITITPNGPKVSDTPPVLEDVWVYYHRNKPSCELISSGDWRSHLQEYRNEC